MTDYAESTTVTVSWAEDGVSTVVHTKQYVRKYPWGDGDVHNDPGYIQSTSARPSTPLFDRIGASIFDRFDSSIFIRAWDNAA